MCKDWCVNVRKIYWHVTVTCQQYEKCLLTCDRYMAAPYPTASGYWHAGLPRYIACISNNNNVFVLHTLLLVLTSAMASQEEVLSCIFVGKVFENYKEVEDLIVNLREVCYYGVKYKERRTTARACLTTKAFMSYNNSLKKISFIGVKWSPLYGNVRECERMAREKNWNFVFKY